MCSKFGEVNSGNDIQSCYLFYSNRIFIMCLTILKTFYISNSRIMLFHNQHPY